MGAFEGSTFVGMGASDDKGDGIPRFRVTMLFGIGDQLFVLGLSSGWGPCDYLPGMIGEDRLARSRDVSICPW